MRKPVIGAVVLTALLSMQSAGVFAVTQTTSAVPVTATVGQVLALDMTIRRENPDGSLGSTVTSMPFNMIRDGNNALRGDAVYHVFLAANTSSRPYTVTSTMGDLTNGSETLPDALGVFPISASTDGNAANDISGDSLASSQSAKGTNKTLYTSNAAGDSSVIELVYGISGGNADGSAAFPGWQPIPPGQEAGNYTASPPLTFTITA